MLRTQQEGAMFPDTGRGGGAAVGPPSRSVGTALKQGPLGLAQTDIYELDS